MENNKFNFKIIQNLIIIDLNEIKNIVKVIKVYKKENKIKNIKDIEKRKELNNFIVKLEECINAIYKKLKEMTDDRILFNYIPLIEELIQELRIFIFQLKEIGKGNDFLLGMKKILNNKHDYLINYVKLLSFIGTFYKRVDNKKGYIHNENEITEIEYYI